MSLSDLASLGSFVSGVAVLASLIFLFFQMRQMTEQVRQTEKNQQALIQQGVRTRGAQLQLTRTEPSTADAYAKGVSGAEDISATQYEQFSGYVSAYLVHLEDAFFQHKRGLLTDDAFATVRGGLKGMLSRPGVRQYWENSRAFFHFPKEFVTFVDDIMADTRVGDPSTGFSVWKAGVSAMKADALQH